MNDGEEVGSVCCKGIPGVISRCEYDSAWLCKHPDCGWPVLTATLYGACPFGCPKKERRPSQNDTKKDIMIELREGIRRG